MAYTRGGGYVFLTRSGERDCPACIDDVASWMSTYWVLATAKLSQHRDPVVYDVCRVGDCQQPVSLLFSGFDAICSRSRLASIWSRLSLRCVPISRRNSLTEEVTQHSPVHRSFSHSIFQFICRPVHVCVYACVYECMCSTGVLSQVQ